MTLRELMEQRGELEKRMRDMVETAEKENRDFTAEEDQAFKQLHDDDVALRNRIDRQVALERHSRELDERADQGIDPDETGGTGVGGSRSGGRRGDVDDREKPTEEDRALAFGAWCRAQMGEIESITEREQEACERLGFDPERRKKLRFTLPSSESVRAGQRYMRSVHPAHRSREEMVSRMVEAGQTRALSSFVGSSGGMLIPQSFINAVEVNMLAFGGVRQVADILRTERGEEMAWPTADDTSNKGRRIGQNKAVNTSAEPNFGRVLFRAYDYTSDAVLVPWALLEDSPFDLARMLGEMLGERLGRITNEENTLGTGDSMPRGIVVAADIGKTTASATAITADEILDLEHSVDPAYRTSDAGFMFHDNVLLAIRKLKDSDGQYLWQRGMQAGVPDRLNNRPFAINMDMADTIEGSADVMLFGQLSKHKIREVSEVRVYRLEERYRDNDQDGFVMFLRQDSNTVDAGTGPIKKLRMKAA